MAQASSRDSMPGSVRIGRLFGIPIFIHVSWLIIFALVTWTLATGYFPQRYPDVSVRGAWLRALASSVLFFAFGAAFAFFPEAAFELSVLSDISKSTNSRIAISAASPRRAPSLMMRV